MSETVRAINFLSIVVATGFGGLILGPLGLVLGFSACLAVLQAVNGSRALWAAILSANVYTARNPVGAAIIAATSLIAGAAIGLAPFNSYRG
ncbi:hypothetical protein E8L99_16610 [Phreatobacter aquaticus]|uniref:Uncharacterized protein n=1 Tax=Phreatobacter aquaticus TaxID=2570229 RepID=A0A4D7QPS6_9HYPH|nr:hypothetical protein [Phreatobacter aquaticus]QCK87264.1 hypothetical protein E8L99_16610 [Phreatobacter aquaticus]